MEELPKNGDVVWLKSGSPPLLVTKTNPYVPAVDVLWLDNDNRPHTVTLVADCVRSTDPAVGPEKYRGMSYEEECAAAGAPNIFAGRPLGERRRDETYAEYLVRTGRSD